MELGNPYTMVAPNKRSVNVVTNTDLYWQMYSAYSVCRPSMLCHLMVHQEAYNSACLQQRLIKLILLHTFHISSYHVHHWSVTVQNTVRKLVVMVNAELMHIDLYFGIVFSMMY